MSALNTSNSKSAVLAEAEVQVVAAMIMAIVVAAMETAAMEETVIATAATAAVTGVEEIVVETDHTVEQVTTEVIKALLRLQPHTTELQP